MEVFGKLSVPKIGWVGPGRVPVGELGVNLLTLMLLVANLANTK